MTIRFLETTPSAHPDYPFQAGQVIRLPRMTPTLRAWLKEGKAELVKETSETAVTR